MRGAGPQVKHLAGGRRFVSRSTLALRMVETTIYTIDSPEPEAPRVPQVGDRIRTKLDEDYSDASSFWWTDREGVLISETGDGGEWNAQLDEALGSTNVPVWLRATEFDLL